jgi:CRISPR/Cas system CMR subunit Cmr6 (Cas7 group RAMP superfamily)
VAKYGWYNASTKPQTNKRRFKNKQTNKKKKTKEGRKQASKQTNRQDEKALGENIAKQVSTKEALYPDFMKNSFLVILRFELRASHLLAGTLALYHLCHSFIKNS